MAQNGYMPGGHLGRIPNYGKAQPMNNNPEPPACIQNAMMTKDKKPFTYTPGGLDLSQIKTPSMARRLARQRSQEEHEQAYAQQQANGNRNYPQANYQPQGGSIPPPPPPPMNIPAPPPPPPLVISAPPSKSPKPNTLAPGERPEIVIPENPIGMLRKTNSPYHWEAEKADQQRMGPVPKFTEKVPSPLTVKMPPSSFSQQPPQNYSPQYNNVQRQNNVYLNQSPDSPLHKPEPQYPGQNYSPVGVTPTRDILQRQDSQFNKSPLPYAGQSPISNGSSFSPSPNSSWRQPEKRDSPATPQSPYNREQFSPNTQQYSRNQSKASPSPASSGPVYNTLPRAGSRPRDNYNYNNNTQTNNNVIYNNVSQQRPPSPKSENVAPWRTNTLNRQSREPENPPSIYHNSQPINQQATNTPPWKTTPEVSNNQAPQTPPWAQEIRNARNPSVNQTRNEPEQYIPKELQDSNNNNQAPQTPPWAQEIRNARNPSVNQTRNEPEQYIPKELQDSNNNNQAPQTPPWAQEIRNARNQSVNQTRNEPEQYIPKDLQDSNNNTVQDNYSPPWRSVQDNKKPMTPPSNQYQSQEQPRYQSSISIPVTARKNKPEPEYNNTPPQKEVVYVNQEPVYFCPDSPKAMPGFVKTQKERTKTPPPIWCQRPLDGVRKSLSRELTTPPREANQEPEWVRLSNEKQRNIREVVSPPKYQQPQPTWSTLPSENRKSIPKENPPSGQSGARVIPIQMEVTNTEVRDHERQGQPQPHLRITIGMQPNANYQGQASPQGPFSQPTQRIMRVLSPQLVRMDDGSSAQHDLPSLNRNFQNNQVKERIIPIHIEGGNDGANRSSGGRR